MDRFWLITSTIILLSCGLTAQAERQLVGSGGGAHEDVIYRVDFSIGEVVTGTRTGGDRLASLSALQGFQQPVSFDVVLPVTWLSFTVSPVGKANHLVWEITQTGAEANYVVERSTDGSGFTEVFRQPIRAGGVGDHQYEWSDRDYPATRLYYRIYQTDLDGTRTYSPLRTLDRSGSLSSKLTLFPNPVTNRVWAALRPGITDDDTWLELYDAAGRRLLREPLSPAGLDLSNLPTGAYAYLLRSGTLSGRGVLMVR